MRTLNEDLLLRQLTGLPIAAQSAFAQACAVRISGIGGQPLSENANRLRLDALKIAREFVEIGRIDQPGMRRVMKEIENLPELDDDRVASAAFVIRHIASEDPQEAIWAARRAYDAVDQAAELNVDEFGPESERALLAHQVVQSELECQTLDISSLQLSSGSAWDIVRRAKSHF